MADCSELSQIVHDVAMAIGAQPEVRTIDDVMKVLQKDFPEITRENVVDSIVEAMGAKTRTVSETSKKLAALKAEARRTSDTFQRQKIQKQIVELTSKLESGDVQPKPRLTAEQHTKELERLAYERDRLRSEIRRRIEDLKPKTVWGRTRGAINAARSLMTTGEFSFVLRQGGISARSHPIQTAKALLPMLRSFANDQYAHKMDMEVSNHPDAPLAKKAGLSIIAPDTVLSGGENAYAAHWAENLPILKNFNRAGRVYLNKIRMDGFSAMAQSLARNGEATLPEAKQLAMYMNESTGHGSLGMLEKSAAGLNTMFFSPRYVASRFQFLSGHSMWGGTARTRSLIAKEYAKMFVGLGVTYAIGAAAGGKVEKDPRSSDFGKIKFGNTRLDPLSGLAQVTTFGSRVATGETKNSAGQIEPLRGPKVKFGKDNTADVMARFARTKLAPVPGAVVNVLSGKDAVGNPASVGSEATKMAYPITYADIYQAIKDQGVPEGTALGLMTFFGDGLQTYKRRGFKMD